MATTIETNDDYEAAALRLGELSRASIESVDHAEFEEISAAMMRFEAQRIAPGPGRPLQPPLLEQGEV
jgi:hypothetical protein